MQEVKMDDRMWWNVCVDNKLANILKKKIWSSATAIQCTYTQSLRIDASMKQNCNIEIWMETRWISCTNYHIIIIIVIIIVIVIIIISLSVYMLIYMHRKIISLFDENVDCVMWWWRWWWRCDGVVYFNGCWSVRLILGFFIHLVDEPLDHRMDSTIWSQNNITDVIPVWLSILLILWYNDLWQPCQWSLNIITIYTNRLCHHLI